MKFHKLAGSDPEKENHDDEKKFSGPNPNFYKDWGVARAIFHLTNYRFISIFFTIVAPQSQLNPLT